MKRTLLLAGATVLATGAFGYTVPTKSSPAAKATTSTAAITGWSKGVKTASVAKAGDFRQMSAAVSAPYSGTFKSTPPTGGMYIFVK